MLLEINISYSIWNAKLTSWMKTLAWCSVSSPLIVAVVAKLLQSCPTLCDPIDGSPPGSCTPGILQARTLQWVAISFSNAWKWKVKMKSLSRVRLLATPWTAAHQAPPSMGFSRQEYWSGVPLPSPSPWIGSSNNCIHVLISFEEHVYFIGIFTVCTYGLYHFER